MDNFRVKLQAVKTGLGVFDCRKPGVVSGGHRLETIR